MVILHGRQSRRKSFQEKEREPCTPVLHSLPPQADTETIAQPGHGDLWTVYSPFFLSACQCLCCFTLCCSQRSWINITSPPQGIPALVSLWLLTAAAEVLLCTGALEGLSHTRDLCVPWMAEPGWGASPGTRTGTAAISQDLALWDKEIIWNALFVSPLEG